MTDISAVNLIRSRGLTTEISRRSLTKWKVNVVTLYTSVSSLA